MSLPPTEEMLVKLRKFVPNPVLLTDPREMQIGRDVPEVWVELLRGQNEGVKNWVKPWEPFRDLLPGVYDFLQHKVRGVCILREDRKPPSLLYVYSRGETNYFYRGWQALGAQVPDGKQEIWDLLPPGLQQFYSDIHNGWVSLSSDSMGPLPVQDIEFLSDQDWDLDAADESKLPFRLDEVITVFSNGGGDYLGLDTGRKDGPTDTHALVWWHEDTAHPDSNQNFWALLDGWISGQVEDVDAAAP